MYFIKCFIYLVAIGIIGFFAGRVIPKDYLKENLFPFRSFAIEKKGKVYERIGIRNWQSKVPDMSRLLPGIMPEKNLGSVGTEKLPVMIMVRLDKARLNMEKRTQQYILVTIAGVSLYAVLMNASSVLEFVKEIISLILPIIVGSILALFISVPMNGIEKLFIRLGSKMKRKISDQTRHILSFIVAIICISAVMIIVLTLLVPEIIRSSKSLYMQIENDIPGLVVYLKAHQINAEWVEELFSDANLDQMIQSISEGIDILLVNVMTALSSTISVVITVAFAIIISIYMTLGKENVCRHANKLVCAYLKPEWAKNILRFCRMFYQSFANFLSGQCSEAVILGILMFLAFSIFKLPYGSLVGVLTAVCAIIPYVGAFISCGVSIFLTMIFDPALVIRCAVVYLAVQFIENQFIYPRVVGKSVGLPPFYTLIAAMIGGKLFGIIGILFFIPLTAVVVELVKEDTISRLGYRENHVI